MGDYCIPTDATQVSMGFVPANPVNFNVKYYVLSDIREKKFDGNATCDPWEHLARFNETTLLCRPKERKAEITHFKVQETESLYDSWDKFKLLLQKCPNNNMRNIEQIQSFVKGVQTQARMLLDASTEGIIRTLIEPQEEIPIEVEHVDAELRIPYQVKEEAQDAEDTEETIDDYLLTRDRLRRVIRPPQRLGYADLIAYALISASDVLDEEPRDYKEVMRSRNKTELLKAMDDEMKSLHDNHTWELIKKPVRAKLVSSSNNVEDVMKVKVELNKEFDMKDLGAASRILWIDIRRDKKQSQLCLSQDTYLQKILEKFGMLNSKPVMNPTNPQFKLSTHQCPNTEVERAYMNSIPYTNIMGSLMYVMVCIRPDITHAISLVSRKSISGYVLTMFGTPISWKPTVQKVISLSTTEVEYITLTEVVKEAL
ncbi:uncharacterized protein LOC127093784 [Lathyrus oleraceus]|uniref:uncharacterized protein LOC127093784 n=1 Tax=Pisum sativum TaxID=3888 RepID=UPI0021CED7CA|nr:uncharacterized protein LOC127093784 [Pisum sativum]